MNINYCVLEVVENGGLLVVYDFGGFENIRFSSLFADGDVSREERGETDVFAGYSLGYVAGFLIFRKKIIADNGLPNLYSLVEYVLLILEFTI